jgi:putative DNA-invertase from lambdoid prophage Rac
MSRVFAYCRVSTKEQTTENQVREIEAAGFAVDKRRIVEETISGASASAQRPKFSASDQRRRPSDNERDDCCRPVRA